MNRLLVIGCSILFALPCAAAPAASAKAKPASQVKTAPAAAAPLKPVTREAEPDPWAGRKDLFVAPHIKPTTRVTIGRVERYKLPNGLQVIVVPRKQIPAVDITLLVRGAGSSSNPLDQSGLAQFTASMLRKGTAKRSADEIAKTIDFVGGELDASAGDDGAFVSCHARSKDLDLCLDLTSDVVEHPTFPDSEMGEIRDQLDANVEGAKDSPEALASEHIDNLFYGDDDPRGRPMSKHSLASIDRAALQKFYSTWYAPNNAVVAISGDVSSPKLRSALKKWFGSWKQHPVPPEAKRTLPAAGALKIRIVDKPDATQTAIDVMGPGLAHSSPDYYAVRLMNYTLGGGAFSSRLMKVVRSNGGKTYGARSSFDAGRDAGPFTVSTFTRTEESGSTLALVMGEIEKMQKSGPTAAELEAAKGNLIGGYGLHLETGSDLARALLRAELDGLDPHYVDRFPQRMASVSLAQAVKAAAKYLHPTALVVVGKAAQVRPMLAKLHLTDTPFEEVAYTDPVSRGERQMMAQEKAKAATVSPAQADAGKALLAAALAAKGGAPALAKVKDLKLTGKGTMSLQGQNIPVEIVEFYLVGKAARQDISLGPQTVSQIFANGKAFMKIAGQVRDLPAQASAAMKAGLWRDPNFILLHATWPGAKVAKLPTETDGGVKYDVLKIVAPSGDWTKLLLDPKTHLIARLVYQEDGKESRDVLSDYKSSNGIVLPHHVVHEGDGQKIDLTYDTIVVNHGLPPDTFQR